MDKIWLRQYPTGVPAEIDVEQYSSLVALLEESFRKYAGRTAYWFMGKSISFADVDAASQALDAQRDTTQQAMEQVNRLQQEQSEKRTERSLWEDRLRE